MHSITKTGSGSVEVNKKTMEVIVFSLSVCVSFLLLETVP